MGDEGNGTVSGFILCPLGGPGSSYFQSSYPVSSSVLGGSFTTGCGLSNVS